MISSPRILLFLWLVPACGPTVVVVKSKPSGTCPCRADPQRKSDSQPRRPRAGDEAQFKAEAGVEKLDLAELVQKVRLADSPAQACGRWRGHQVRFEARVFNTEVDTRTDLHRLLLDPPAEIRSVTERMDAGEKVVMVACTSYRPERFLLFNRGALVRVTGNLGSIDTSNTSWFVLFIDRYRVERLSSDRQRVQGE